MSDPLHVQSLSLSFGTRVVLRGVELRLRAGELVGLIGPNGSGKSSLMRACAGLLPVAGGRVQVEGFDVGVDALAARRCLGYAVEPDRLPAALRGRQCIELVVDARGLGEEARHDALRLSDELGLTPWIEQEVAEYSLGTRQKLAVVLALVGKPTLLLLDEVLNGLDPLSAFALKQELRRRADGGAAVLLATHGLEVAERFLDRAVLLLDGLIAADWDRAELQRLRSETDGGLEAAVVARLRAAAAR